MGLNRNFWKNKRVLITGHTGFKGSWLTMFLLVLQAKVWGYALAPLTTPNLFDQLKLKNEVDSTIEDIRNTQVLKKKLKDCAPEMIIHMAAQPLVLNSYKMPFETYAVNVMGTASLLEAARSCASVKSIVVITTDKCYENTQKNNIAFREDDKLGGSDPYSSSKACCEILTQAYYQSFFSKGYVGVATARAGNVIGGGDWADNRLIPDLMRSVKYHTSAIIRYPHAIRPWQHVLEALSGYLKLMELLYENPRKYSGPWNFGPDFSSVTKVCDVLKIMKSEFPDIKIDIPKIAPQLYEATFLQLDSTKAQQQLNWNPKWDLQNTLRKVADWYKGYFNNENLRQLTNKQIFEFLNSYQLTLDA